MAGHVGLDRKLLRAARQRLTAAEFLLSPKVLAMNLDATYLAGYGVECALKAVLLASVAENRRTAVMDKYFRGARGHNLDLLVEALREFGRTLPPPVLAEFRRVRVWITDWRYDVGHKPHRDAALFVKGAKVIVRWAEEMV